MRYLKWLLASVGVFLCLIVGIEVFGYLFDVFFYGKHDDIRMVCQEVIAESPIIYYQDGSGLPKDTDEEE